MYCKSSFPVVYSPYNLHSILTSVCLIFLCCLHKSFPLQIFPLAFCLESPSPLCSDIYLHFLYCDFLKCGQSFFVKNYLFIYLFIYFWLHWVFGAARGLSLVVVSGGYSSLRCAGFSLRWLLLLWNTGSRRMGFSSCGMWAQKLWLVGSRAQAQYLWCTGLAAPRHLGSSRTRARTRVSCTGRRILNHCATREVPGQSFLKKLYSMWNFIVYIYYKSNLFVYICIYSSITE